MTEEFALLTASESLRARELVARTRMAERYGGWDKIVPFHKRRADFLKKALIAQRKKIWISAQRTGWQKANRLKRYEILSRLTTT